MSMYKFQKQTILRKIALLVQVYKHHAPCFCPWNQEKGLPLGSIKWRGSKKLVTMEFSSSKESVLRILATLRISILRMKQMFDSQTLCNILCLPINNEWKTKCKPSALPPPLDQTCQFPMMSFLSHNKGNCSFSGEDTKNWGSKKRFCTSQTVGNISFRVSGYINKESENRSASLRNLSTTSTAISLRKNNSFVTTVEASRSLSLWNKRGTRALSLVKHVRLWKVNPSTRDSVFNRQPLQWSVKIMQNQRENGERRKETGFKEKILWEKQGKNFPAVCHEKIQNDRRGEHVRHWIGVAAARQLLLLPKHQVQKG